MLLVLLAIHHGLVAKGEGTHHVAVFVGTIPVGLHVPVILELLPRQGKAAALVVLAQPRRAFAVSLLVGIVLRQHFFEGTSPVPADLNDLYLVCVREWLL